MLSDIIDKAIGASQIHSQLSLFGLVITHFALFLEYTF